jgi:hypothetical protein
MDRTVAREAELKLVVLALGPIQAVQREPLDVRVRALALTVWPALLAPAIEADQLLMVRDPSAAALSPAPDEQPSTYVTRICGAPLARQCKRVVPELQGEVVEAYALRRATERARNAVGECLSCDTDPGWSQAVVAWEALDRVATDRLPEIERRADPGNWPIAGAASEQDPGLPEAIAVLRELRGDAAVIAVHLHPETTLASARGFLADARKAGVQRVAVVAREPEYPYERRVYWVAGGYGLRANLRASDSLQLLVHAIDEVAGPGTVARID